MNDNSIHDEQPISLYWIDKDGRGHLSFVGRPKAVCPRLYLTEEKLNEYLWTYPPANSAARIGKFRVSNRVEATNSSIYAVTFYEFPPPLVLEPKEFFAI